MNAIVEAREHHSPVAVTQVGSGGLALTSHISVVRAGRRVSSSTQVFHPSVSAGREPERLARARSCRMRSAKLARRSATILQRQFERCRSERRVDLVEMKVVAQDIAWHLEEDARTFIDVTRSMGKRDVTFMHSVGVCASMMRLAREAGLPAAEVLDLGIAGLFHDIGKTMIDDSILQKVGQLSEGERADIRRHPQLGHDMLTAIEGLPQVVFDVCLHHHERPDGTGYPFGHSDGAISRAARIAGICDVHDALTSERPYKKRMTPINAIDWMKGTQGQFDRELLLAFARVVDA